MTVINTNTAAINAQYNLNKVQDSMENAMQRLSSGKRINSAADDAAGLGISSRMESQVRGLQMSIRNANDGISLVQSVEGALQESTNILQRMYELTVQASNSTYNDSDRAALQNEIGQLQAELDRISADTEFNGQKMLDGSFTDKSLSVGFSAEGAINFSVGDHSSTGLSAEGTKDALMNLVSTAANVAVGLNNQFSEVTTAQAAIVKADNQGIANAMSQHNVGFDNTQKITVTTITENLSVTASDAAMTLLVDTTADDGTDDASTGSDNATIDAVAAGTNFSAAGVIDMNESVVGNDGNRQVQSYVMDDLTFQTGDIIATDIDGSGNTVSHTVVYSDLVGDDAAANNEAILNTFVNKFNAATMASRTSGTANDAGVVTASVDRNADGELMLVFTAANSSGTQFDATMTVTKYTADTTAAAASSATSSTGSVGALNTITLSGKYEEGDTITIAVSDAFDTGGFEYEVKASDLGASNAITRANIMTNLIAEFNAASETVRSSATAGLYTAATTTTADEIKFTASDTTASIANTLSATIGDRTALGAAAAATVTALEVTADTIRNGTVDGDFTAGVAATTATRVVRFSNDVEEGDIVKLTIGDQTVEYEVTAANAGSGANVATAIAALINNPDGTGSKMELSGAGELTATTSTVDLTITAENSGAAGDFDVSIETTNAVAVAQVRIAQISALSNVEEGDTFYLGVGADNKIGVTITKDVAAMANTDQIEWLRDQFVAKSDELQGFDVEAFGTDGDQVKITSQQAGESFTVLTTAGQVAKDGDNRAQVDKATISGLAEAGDVFKIDLGANDVSITVGAGTLPELGGGQGIELLEKNEDRIAAIVDALIYKVNNDTTLSASVTASAGENPGEILLTAVTAGTGFTATTSAATNNSTQVPAVKQENIVSLSGEAEEGDVYTISLNNGSALSYTVSADDAAGGIDTLRSSLIAAAGSQLSGVDVSAGTNSGELVLTSSTAGEAFEVTVSATNAADVAQIEAVSFANVEAGDAFTVTIGEEAFTYTASEGEGGSDVAAWMAANANFAGKSLSVADGSLMIEGAGGESFTVATSTSNFAGGVQSDSITLSGTVETNDSYTVSINGADVTYAVVSDDATMGDVAANLAAAINASDAGASVTASATEDGTLSLTANEKGTGYDVSVSVSDVGRSRNSVGAIDISTEAGATAAKEVLLGAISQVNETRSELGAIENRLDHTINNLGNVVVNTEASKSRILDADFASETAALTKSQILSQAATAMLAQANASKQSILSLLQG